MGASPLPLLLMGPGPWGAKLVSVKSINAGTEVQPGTSLAPTMARCSFLPAILFVWGPAGMWLGESELYKAVGRNKINTWKACMESMHGKACIVFIYAPHQRYRQNTKVCMYRGFSGVGCRAPPIIMAGRLLPPLRSSQRSVDFLPTTSYPQHRYCRTESHSILKAGPYLPKILFVLVGQSSP